VRKHKRKKVRIAPAPLSAPSRAPLNLVTCHKPVIPCGFYGGDDGARTRDLCRDSLLVLGLSTTYKPMGNA
jgi:hypothetical protein